MVFEDILILRCDVILECVIAIVSFSSRGKTCIESIHCSLGYDLFGLFVSHDYLVVCQSPVFTILIDLSGVVEFLCKW